MKKILFTIGFLLLASQVYAYTPITPDAYISPDDVTIARLQGNSVIYTNAINNFDGGNIKAGTITNSQLDANTSPVTRWQESFNNYVYTGLLPTTSASLTSTTSSGTAYIQGTRVVKDATSYTYPATEWTFVDLSNVGTYTYSSIAIGGGTPAVATNSMRLCRVSSDSTTINAVRDDRVMGISLSIEDEYRTGMLISVATPDAITINPGITYVGSVRIAKTANTSLALGTASDWASGITQRANSTMGFVVVNNTGDIKLTTTAPTTVDTAGNTTGKLRYSVIGGAYWRVIAWFYMNNTGSGNINGWEYSQFKDGLSISNITFVTDDTLQTLDKTAYNSINGTFGHFYTSSGKVKIHFVGASTAGGMTNGCTGIYTNISRDALAVVNSETIAGGATNGYGQQFTNLFIDSTTPGSHLYNVNYKQDGSASLPVRYKNMVIEEI